MSEQRIKCVRIDLDQLSARSLREAVNLHPNFNWQAARAWINADDIRRAAEPAQVLYRPATGRAGVAWQDTASWVDCKSIEDAVRWYLAASSPDGSEAEA